FRIQLHRPRRRRIGAVPAHPLWWGVSEPNTRRVAAFLLLQKERDRSTEAALDPCLQQWTRAMDRMAMRLGRAKHAREAGRTRSKPIRLWSEGTSATRAAGE